jgi:hypothetical protein
MTERSQIFIEFPSFSSCAAGRFIPCSWRWADWAAIGLDARNRVDLQRMFCCLKSITARVSMLISQHDNIAG